MPVLEIPINQRVHPFANAKRFQDLDLNRVWQSGDWGKVLDRPICFAGISGQVELFAHRIFDISGPGEEPTDTPLGDVQMVVGYDRAGFVAVRKLPLAIMFGFRVESLYEYRYLEDFRATLHLGSRRFFMPCRSDKVGLDEVQMLLERGQSVNLLDYRMFDEQGNVRDVKLPHNLTAN